MSETVECTVCGAEVGKGPGGLGLASHANKHRREFRERVGRRPEDYQEVREKIGTPHPSTDPNQPTLWEALTDEEQATRPWRATAPLELENRGRDGWALDRVALPVRELALFRDAAGRFWTAALSTVRGVDGSVDAITVGNRAPPGTDAERVAERVAEPRSSARSSLLGRFYGKLF